MPEVPTECFHCGEPFEGRTVLWAHLHDSDIAVCCPGCRAAAQLIAACGLEDFYQFRTSPSSKPQEVTAEWLAYDEVTFLDSLTRGEPNSRSVLFSIAGLTCATCSLPGYRC